MLKKINTAQGQSGRDLKTTCSSDAGGTFLGSILIPLLNQQVARTLRQERQHAELQHGWERQEGKQVVPSGLLQTTWKTNSDVTETQKGFLTESSHFLKM